MPEEAVTVIRCRKCRRSADVALFDGRFWCAWCQTWAEVEVERVRDATVRRDAAAPTLVRATPAGLPLQPLRIPAGWHVKYNNGLYKVDPLPGLIPEDDRWWVFKQDMLWMVHPQSNRLLDLGWYPEGDLVSGQYGLVVYEGNFRGRLLHEFDTRDRLVLVAEIERLLGGSLWWEVVVAVGRVKHDDCGAAIVVFHTTYRSNCVTPMESGIRPRESPPRP